MGSWPLLDLKVADDSTSTHPSDKDGDADDADDVDDAEGEDKFGLRPFGESGYRYLNQETMQSLFYFSEDTKAMAVSPFQLNDPCASVEANPGPVVPSSRYGLLAVVTAGAFSDVFCVCAACAAP